MAARLPDNVAVRFEIAADKHELVLSQLDKLDEPASLVELRKKVTSMLPRVDLPELILEVAARPASPTPSPTFRNAPHAQPTCTSVCARY